MALAPGAYVFRFIGRDVVQVLSADLSSTYAMFLVTPVTRIDMTHEYAVKLRRVSSAAPPRIVSVFLPGSIEGRGFNYPKPTIAPVTDLARR